MRTKSILVIILLTTFFCFVNVPFSFSWSKGDVSLNSRKTVSGVDFKNQNYEISATKFVGNQGKKDKQYEDLGVKGRTYKITKIQRYKKINPISVIYPRYLYLKRTNTYYDLSLTVRGVYSNKSVASFTLGRIPEISINGKFKNKKIVKGATTSLIISQKIRVSNNQKNPRKLNTFVYYSGIAELDNNEAIKYLGNYSEKQVFKDKKAKKTACKYANGGNGITVFSAKKINRKHEDMFKVYFRNDIVKVNVSKENSKINAEKNTFRFRYGGLKNGGRKYSKLIFMVRQPNLAKEKTNRIINRAIKFADKYAKDDSFHYTNYSSEDKKTQKCPVCYPELQKIDKYCGWNCIGYVSAAFFHAGVKTVECRAGGIVNDYFAGYDRLTEKNFQERNGKDWHLILKENKYLPESKLLKGDVLICYSGKTFKHICIYDGKGYIYDAKSSGDNISRRPYSTIGVTPKIAFRYRIDSLK